MTLTPQQESYLELSSRLCKGKTIVVAQRKSGSILIERIYKKGKKDQVFPYMVTKIGNWRDLNSFVR